MLNPYEVLRPGGDLDIVAYEENVINVIREHVGSAHVLLGLSGGVDSSVCAALLAKAVPGRLHCIFVDHGLMRKDEGDQVEKAFESFDLNLVRVNAEDRFLSRLAGVTEPETKRKIIGEQFIRVFEEESGKLPMAEYLAQGTIYPDVAESGVGEAALIKSHHNVGGLPENMSFIGLVEPLRGLYKAEVRELGVRLGLPASLTGRQPFPGPGLALRCIGEITKERLDTLREADAIFRSELEASGIKADQYFAILTNMRSVGVKNNARTYGYTVALRAVETVDFVSCKYVPLPHDLLCKVSERITGELQSINRVVYDITGKPPGTIEWE
jgi:GMP synthase (glutamine-hydrolysing)